MGKITVEMILLGTGTSTGVPLLTCTCRVCKSKNPKDKRLRASAWVKTRGKSFIIDTSTDFRQQAFRAKIDRVDFVLYTHPHTDHVSGIDELRAYNFAQRAEIPLYGNAYTLNDLRSRYPYIFNPGPVEGGGIPQLTLNPLPEGVKEVSIQGVKVTTLPLKHGSLPCLGFRIDSVAYVTDCSYIPPETMDALKGLSVLVLDCVRLKPHGTHLNLDQALDVVAQVKPRKAALIHMSHDFEYRVWKKRLPRGVELSYDGMKIRRSS